MSELTDLVKECAYKAEEECTPQERMWRKAAQDACLKHFTYFLEYVKILEPPSREARGGAIPFERWPHLEDAIRALLTDTLIVWMKSRQIGASWLLSAYDLWFAISGGGTRNMGANILIYSKGELEAQEKLAKCKRVYNQLPTFLQFKVDPNSATEMGFPEKQSSIKALAATETAGIGYTASVIDADEWEEHPYADANYLSSKPTRDAGGQFIGVFTVNKQKPDTLAKAIFRDAFEGKNDFTWLFTPWHARPGRTQEWYDGIKRNIPERDLATLTPDLFMEQAYPASIEEALRLPQDVSAFDHKVLDGMVENTRSPVKVEGIDLNVINIFQPYHIGNFYIASSDTAHGVGKDYSVTAIMNVQTGAVVADIFNNVISPEEFAMHTVKLLNLYNNPLWYPEDNDWGRVTITTAQGLGYKNFGLHGSADIKKDGVKEEKLGWHTTEPTRNDLFGGLIPAINNNQIVIFNSKGLKQFYDIIRNVAKNGRIEAMGGRHDDYPISVGICWAKRKEVKTSVEPLSPISTLTFGDGDDKVLDRWLKR